MKSTTTDEGPGQTHYSGENGDIQPSGETLMNDVAAQFFMQSMN